MDAELAALAASGAGALAGAMVTDAWAQARVRVARLLACGGDERSVRVELATAGLFAARDAGDASRDVEVRREWEARLRELLRVDPAAATELRALTADLARVGGGGVHNRMSGGVVHGPVIQAGSVGDVAFGA